MPRTQKHRRTFRHGGKLIGDRTFSSKRLADAWYEKMRRKAEAIDAGLPVEAEDSLIREAVAEWIAIREVKSDFWHKDNQKMMLMVPRFGDKTVKGVTRPDCELVLHGIRRDGNLSGATFNRYRSCLHTFFEYCIDKEIRDSNPVSRIERMAEMQKGTYVPNENARAYIGHLRAEEPIVYFAFVALGMNSGARPGELLGLMWSDYKPELRRIEIRRRYQRDLKRVKEGTKGGKGRMVPLNDFAIAAIEEYRKQAPATGPEDFIFQDPKGGMMSVDKLQTAHEHARAAAGLSEEVRLYDITRHKYASEVTQAFGLRAAQEVLGHSTSALTERYAHSDPASLVNKLAGAITVGDDPNTRPLVKPASGGKRGTKVGPARDLSQQAKEESDGSGEENE